MTWDLGRWGWSILRWKEEIGAAPLMWEKFGDDFKKFCHVYWVGFPLAFIFLRDFSKDIFTLSAYPVLWRVPRRDLKGPWSIKWHSHFLKSQSVPLGVWIPYFLTSLSLLVISHNTLHTIVMDREYQINSKTVWRHPFTETRNKFRHTWFYSK